MLLCVPPPKSLLTWPHGTPCPSPVYPLPTSYPVAGAFAGGAAEISPFCPGSRASAMLVARQQPLAHHCNFRDGRDGSGFPSPLYLESPVFIPCFYITFMLFPGILVGSQHFTTFFLEFWITAFQKLLPILLSSIHYSSPSIENHFNSTIRPVSSRIMTILEIY